MSKRVSRLIVEFESGEQPLVLRDSEVSTETVVAITKDALNLLKKVEAAHKKAEKIVAGLDKK